MIISFFNLSESEEKIIKNKFSSEELRFFQESINKTNIECYKDSDIICICPKSNLNSNILTECAKLKYVISRSTGIDHIDVDFCHQNSITVKNVVGYGSISVSEYQFSLLLNLTRKINQVQNSVRKNGFIKDGLQGTDLFGKTIGIIGYGNIGKMVAKISKVFGMHVLVYTKTINKKTEKTDGIKYVTLDELYRRSDVVSINIPSTDDTYHLIDEHAFDKMRDNVIIVNTSRGSIIDTSSLIKALDKGKILGVALDVIEGEKYIKGDFSDVSEKEKKKVKENFKKLLQFENVIVSPHNAYNTKESVARILDETIKNLEIILHWYKKTIYIR